MEQPASVLVVEDETIIALDIKTTLTNLGYSVPAVAAEGAEAVEQVAALAPDLVLMDIHLRGAMDGVAAAALIRDRFDVPVVYLTAYADPSTVQRARLTEPYGYVLKPFEERELRAVIEMALYRHEMARRLKESERWLAATLRSIGDGVIAADGEWRVRFMNPVAEKLTGWQAGNAIGRELAEVLRVSITMPPRPLVAGDGLAGGGVAEGVLVTLDGRELPIEESSTTIRDAAGKVVGSVVAIRDITERPRSPAPHDGAGESPRARLAQNLSAALAQLEVLVHDLVDDAPAAQRARQAARLLAGALDDLHGVARP